MPSAQAPLAQRLPQQLALGRLHDEIVKLLGGQEMLARGVQERDAPPLARGNGPGQPFQRADLDFVILLVRTRMVGLGAEEFGAGGQFVPQHWRDEIDRPLLVPELGRLIEGQPIHSDGLRRALEGDAMPSMQSPSISFST